MERVYKPTLYIRLRKRATAKPGETVTLGNVARLLGDPEVERDLRNLPLIRPSGKDGNVVLVDMMHIVKSVHQKYPGLQVEHFGEPHVLIEVQQQLRKPNRLALAAVWLLLFIGSGLAIMNFHADVSMQAVHQRLYEMITGVHSEHPYWLQIPYSIGLGAGMVLFFNQLFQKRFNEEPSPLEVEIFTYQESLNHYMITEEYNKLLHTEPSEPAAESDPQAASRKRGDLEGGNGSSNGSGGGG